MCCHVLIPDSPPAPVAGPAQLRDNKLVVIEFRVVYCTLNYPSIPPDMGTLSWSINSDKKILVSKHLLYLLWKCEGLEERYIINFVFKQLLGYDHTFRNIFLHIFSLSA